MTDTPGVASEGRLIPHGWVAGILSELRCGAEQNTANLPANNPPHVCVRPKDHTGPHGDYSVPPFEWDQPEPRHTLRPP